MRLLLSNSFSKCIALLFILVFLPYKPVFAGPAQVVEKVMEKAIDSIVAIKFDLDIAIGENQRSVEINCSGTMVDSSGIVLLANSFFNASTVNAGRSISLQAQPRDFTVIVEGTTYEAKLVYKNPEKDYALLSIGAEEGIEDAEDQEEFDYDFQAISFVSRKLKIGDPLMAVVRSGERENHVPTFFPFYISSVVTTPKSYYHMTISGLNLKGIPAFDPNGEAVGLICAYTLTTATGQSTATNQVIVRSADDLESVIETIVLADEEDSESDEEDDQELNEDETELGESE